MSDPANVDFNDPLQVGIFVTKIQSDMAGMQLATATAQQAMSSTMQAMQSDLQSVAKSLDQLALLNQRQATDNESIKRIWERLERIEERSDKRWTEFLAENDKYRDTMHSRSNSNRDKVNRVIAIGLGAAAVLGVASTIVYDTLGDARTYERAERAAADRRIESNDSRLDKIEVFMAGDKERPFTR